MKEYDIAPKQVWRVAGRLLHDVVYEPGIEKKNEWVYASAETPEHRERFVQWIESKRIDPAERIWVIVTNPAEDTKEMNWCEFLSRWTEFLSDSDLKVADKAFTWVLEYKSQHAARFGRKPRIRQAVDGNPH